MTFQKFTAWSLVALFLMQSSITPAIAGNPVIDALKRVGPRQGHPPKTHQDKSLEELASNIDWLEHEIDHWGSIVPKTPDVWGEARLTQHKYEVEQQLAKLIGEFEFGQINAAQFVNDQAFLAAALSMKFKPTLPTGTQTGVDASSATAIIANTTATTGDTGPASVVSRIDTSATDKVFGIQSGKLTIGGDGLRLEQIEELDQLKRYMDHLNELRRINEGDDATDAPGYSLNLVRIPISILPGTKSREGYGAEITVTATPQVGPELLPVSFKDFVINDLVDQLAVPLTRFLNDDPLKARALLHIFAQYEAAQYEVERIRSALTQFGCSFAGDDSTSVLFRAKAQEMGVTILDVETGCINVSNVQTIALEDLLVETQKLATIIENDIKPLGPSAAGNVYAQLAMANSSRHSEMSDDSLNELPSVGLEAQYRAIAPQNSLEPIELYQQRLENKIALLENVADMRVSRAPVSLELEAEARSRSLGRSIVLRNQLAGLPGLAVDLRNAKKQIEGIASKVVTATVPSSSARRATLPYPPSQLVDVIALHILAHVASSALEAFSPDVVNRQVVHFTDVQKYLREELSAAYDMLSLPQFEGLWQSQMSGDRALFEVVRRGDIEQMKYFRQSFFDVLGPSSGHRTMSILAWAVFVESILLNEKMIEDMQQTVNKHGGSMAPPCWMAFFGPNPPPEARAHFGEYVTARWPLKIFTVDPVNSEQNVADVSTVYRQMQLSIALSVASGEMGANAALNTLRKVQRDIATIDLNRTVVGFSHGDDTFGWRFQPRFQASPVEGNLTVFFRDLVAGGPTDDQLEQSKQIEPGMRECIALVLMPSFVPGVRFDTRGNWFKLTRPSHTAMSAKENLEYSRSVEAMRNNAMQCVKYANLYRPGEVDRLLRRVDQLDHELPFQTMHCQVPIENSLGGFEIFSSGSREFAPELLGWYGAPGYDPQAGASFFLAGDNFSVNRTSVIAGNRGLAINTMLSRQIIQVTLPPGLPVLKDERVAAVPPGDYEGYVDVHVATPYGASGHLLIPVVKKQELQGSALQFRKGYLRLVGKVKSVKDTTHPSKFTLTVEELKFDPTTGIHIDLPKLNALGRAATLAGELWQQTATGPEKIVFTPDLTPLSGSIDASLGIMSIPPENLETLRGSLQTRLTSAVQELQVSSLRIPCVLTGQVTAGTVLTGDEVIGGIPVDIVLTPL